MESRSTGPHRSLAPPVARGWISRLRAAAVDLDALDAVVLVLTLGALAAWRYAVLHRYFDYDEQEHLYAVWMIKTGAKPFFDFFECHPPFLWYPLAAVLRLTGETFDAFFVFRWLSAAGHLAFLGAIAKNLSLSFKRLPQPLRLSPRTFAITALLMVGNPTFVEYLLEFRLDAWPNALLLWAIYRYRRPESGGEPFRAACELSALSSMAILCSPKLAVFFTLFVGASIAADRDRLRRLAGLAAGGLGAIALGALVLIAAGLNPIVVYRFSLAYHSLLNRNGGFHRGLVMAIWAEPVPLGIVTASFLAWVFSARTCLRAFTFEIVIACFLVIQVLMVSFGWKQYTVPWFLLAGTFVPYLDVALRRVRPLHAMVVAVAVAYVGVNVVDGYRGFKGNRDTEAQASFNAWQWSQMPTNGVAVASQEYMPLYRHSSHYHLVNSFSPTGYNTEAVMKDLAMEPFSSRTTEESYQQELEARHPDLIVLEGAFSTAQRRALDGFVTRHADEYQRVASLRGPVLLRRR